MAMTIKQARGMFPGNQLTFGDNPAVFEVVEVQQRAGGVYLVLKRDDGYETFATEKDLDVASLVQAAMPEENPYLAEIAALKQQLEQAQAAKVDDPPNGAPSEENPQIGDPLKQDANASASGAADAVSPENAQNDATSRAGSSESSSTPKKGKRS